MKKSKVLTFFGSGSLAAASLNFLYSNYAVKAVITKLKPAYHKEPAPVEKLALSNGTPLYFANNTSELNKLFINSNIDTGCGIVIDYGVIISQQVINRFPLGIINSHFSLLPEWRGADPITYSILSGQNKTGVSLMLIDDGLDTGKILAQENIAINPNENNQSLCLKLINLNNSLLNNALNNYLIGSIKTNKQKHRPVTYSTKILKSWGAMDFNKPSAVLEREVRAFNPWPGSFFVLNGIRLTVTKAEASDYLAEPGKVSIDPPDKIYVGCRVGSLEILEVKPDGKNNMPVKAFINGYSAKIL